MQEIESASAPARKLGDQHGIDFAPLSERDHLFPLGAIEFRARAGFFEYANHLVAGARRESGQIALLPGAGLIGSAFYAIATDHVQMPPYETFREAEGYYSILLHELAHWTGNPKRLAREFGTRWGDARYAAEELVAELGAAFLCADLGWTC